MMRPLDNEELTKIENAYSKKIIIKQKDEARERQVSALKSVHGTRRMD